MNLTQLFGLLGPNSMGRTLSGLGGIMDESGAMGGGMGAPTGGILAPAAPPVQSHAPGIMSRVMGGLLGQPSSYGGLLDKSAQDAAGSDGRMALAASLLEASGPSTQRVGLGQAIGRGIMAGRNAQNGSLQDALQAQLMQSQISKNARGDLPTSAEEYEYYKKLPPEEQKIYMEMRAKSGPAAIQEFQYFKSLSPEDQATFIKLQRQPTVPKVVDYKGGKALIDPVTGVVTPLSSATDEASAAAEIERAKSEASATGTGAGAVTADIIKKGNQAANVTDLLDIAEPLIAVSTGSAAGNMVDKVAGFFGKSLDGATAIARLKTITGQLIAQMPRMEGPQSDADRLLYQQAAGDLANPNVPQEQRIAAAQTIRQLQEKWKSKAAAVGSKPGSGAKPQETAAERAKRLGL